ncbi:hypothetical protein OG979_22625 [Actinomadura citrea]|uniref:hypothetical protein n=1 Tax=Actinomadura citrea TaxID=46158 RepID=UPI002E2BFFB1|nr:hypothetical protein [Actinomadura citrea]
MVLEVDVQPFALGRPDASDGRNDQSSADSEAAEVPPEPSGISPFGAMNRRLCNGSEACRDFVS